jgi:hypothetical protein
MRRWLPWAVWTVCAMAWAQPGLHVSVAVSAPATVIGLRGDAWLASLDADGIPLGLALRTEIGYAWGAAAPSLALLGLVAGPPLASLAVTPYLVAGGGLGFAPGGVVPAAVVAVGARAPIAPSWSGSVELGGTWSRWGRSWSFAVAFGRDLGWWW